MTSNVTITAHCGEDKEVHVVCESKQFSHACEEFDLQDGETADRVFYDDLKISVIEREKAG